ncbi:hypothetical protein A2U01_0083676, partial [Trifolium medium]|nr:hypothetical protein [Trifolium medium]
MKSKGDFAAGDNKKKKVYIFKV